MTKASSLWSRQKHKVSNPSNRPLLMVKPAERATAVATTTTSSCDDSLSAAPRAQWLLVVLDPGVALRSTPGLPALGPKDRHLIATSVRAWIRNLEDD